MWPKSKYAITIASLYGLWPKQKYMQTWLFTIVEHAKALRRFLKSQLFWESILFYFILFHGKHFIKNVVVMKWKAKGMLMQERLMSVFGEVSKGSLFNITRVITNKVHSPFTTTHAHSWKLCKFNVPYMSLKIYMKYAPSLSLLFWGIKKCNTSRIKIRKVNVMLDWKCCLLTICVCFVNTIKGWFLVTFFQKKFS